MWKKTLAAAIAVGWMSGQALAMRPVTIEDQGSFFAGGKIVTAPGAYVDEEPLNFDGETLHGDAAYVFYQQPMKAKKNAMVFLHGYRQSGKSWETTPDGRGVSKASLRPDGRLLRRQHQDGQHARCALGAG